MTAEFTGSQRIESATPDLAATDGPAALVVVSFANAMEPKAERDLLRGEAITLPIALVAMIFIFGGLRAAGMPLAVAAGGYLTAMTAMTAMLGATFVLDSVSVFALNVVSMLGLGLGITNVA